MGLDAGMGEEGPYRQAGGVACPACATVMLAADGGGLICPRECGEWVPQEVVDQQWGLVVALDGDARLKWRVGGAPVPCPRCRTPMTRVVHPGWQSQHCPTHGVWFVGKARAAFERDFAHLIARHRAYLLKVEQLTTLLRAAGAGDASAMQHVVHRILLLEAKLEHLETTVTGLAAIPR